ncbi:hypothetical protein QTN25_002140 [Entamoeba marina]
MSSTTTISHSSLFSVEDERKRKIYQNRPSRKVIEGEFMPPRPKTTVKVPCIRSSEKQQDKTSSSLVSSSTILANTTETKKDKMLTIVQYGSFTLLTHTIGRLFGYGTTVVM